MLRGGVIDDQIHHKTNAVRMQLCREALPVVERPELVHNITVIGDIVPVIVIRTLVTRRDPDGVHTEVKQMRNLLPDAVQIPDPVTVRITETARIDLIDDPVVKAIILCSHILSFDAGARRAHILSYIRADSPRKSNGKMPEKPYKTAALTMGSLPQKNGRIQPPRVRKACFTFRRRVLHYAFVFV